jgi:hypothetical protein
MTNRARPHRAFQKAGDVIQRPVNMSNFEFVVLSGRRAAQLMRGCTPKFQSSHKAIMSAQLEVAGLHVARAADEAAVVDAV